MSRVDKPIRVEVTGGYGHGHGLVFSNPRKTRTRDTGVTGCDVLIVRRFSPPPTHRVFQLWPTTSANLRWTRFMMFAGLNNARSTRTQNGCGPSSESC